MLYLEIALLVISFLLIVTGATLFVLARSYVKKEMFENFYGGKNAIYGGFRIFKYEYYQSDKLWVCTSLRVVFIGLLMVFPLMYMLAK
ncbi:MULTISPECIES: hypothetical protein [Idiomarina]|uniref:hypothetical protein n=1 Tax=Idiomarina TaxID=135575 RepID=UPI00129CF05F|nr:MULTISPECIES: hypothetical protein [Idiomarina]MRJ42705.1 hypothetical protein [Idiomarina sp. FeN1]NCU58269.1 hypothetical protein [Idiomarina sp. FenA--70]NCU60967.1 hypothetical protein [Idiomarina sp. FenBw--71]UUN14116.1 hypothetical protein KGF88_02520 [Idiomarina loihiensis]